MKIFIKNHKFALCSVLAFLVLASTLFCFNDVNDKKVLKLSSDDLNKKIEKSSVIKSNEKTENISLINYEISDGCAVIYINDKEVIRLTETINNIIPEVRGKILTSRLQKFIEEKNNPITIIPASHNGIAVGSASGKILFTADKKTAKSLDMTASELAGYWTNNIREAFGVPRIIRDHTLIASRSNVSNEFAKNYMHRIEIGVASWYGGFFHGRTAADGSIYDKNKFTAAHKKLPFGSIVKVTNLENNKTCLVKITDRGPYVGERIIDLSRAAAKEIGMLERGVSKVKLEIIGKARRYKRK